MMKYLAIKLIPVSLPYIGWVMSPYNSTEQNLLVCNHDYLPDQDHDNLSEGLAN